MGILRKTGALLDTVRVHFSKGSVSATVSPAYAPSRPSIFFLGCIVFYFVYLATMQPEWVFGGQMWAEMATNYFVHAGSDSLLQRLFATDAGYIPLPQRLLAMLGAGFHIPIPAVPYFYTWTALVATGAMVGAFCLRPFRSVIPNDYLRLAVSIAVLMAVDFETRTFINFTYFAAFLVAILCALALADQESEVPVWAWIVPVLMFSKPALLAVLPVMLCVALVSRRRFRLIALASLLLCLAQIVQMSLSHADGAFSATQYIGPIEKAMTGLRYFFGFLAGLGIGRDAAIGASALRWLGLLGVTVLALVVLFRSARSRALIVVGLTLVLFNMLLNAFALSSTWNADMSMMNGLPLFRHMIVAFFGVALIITGLIDSEVEFRIGVDTLAARIVGPLVFVAWFCLAGWFGVSGSLNRLPPFPATQSSHWQQMTTQIESGKPACVPIDPLGWFYQRNCTLISSNVAIAKPFQFRPLEQAGGSAFHVSLDIPEVKASQLLGIALLIRPAAGYRMTIVATATAKMRDGTMMALAGARNVDANGGLIMLSTNRNLAFGEITSVTVVFDAPVDLAYVSGGSGKSEVAAIWLGY